MRLRAIVRTVARTLWKPLPLFSCSGVPVQFHLATLVFPFALLLCAGWDDDGISGLGMAACLFAIVFCSLLIHEFAHVFAARFFGCATRRVVMLPIGCVAEMRSIQPGASEIVIALAGPVASGVLALLACAASHAHWMHLPAGIRDLTEAAWLFNATIAWFNLLPCFPMDGGRILRSLLAIILRRKAPRCAADPFLAATRIVVRRVTPPLVITILFATVLHTHLWSHLLLFPIVLFLGEVEYRSIKKSFGNDPYFSARQRRAELVGEFA